MADVNGLGSLNDIELITGRLVLDDRILSGHVEIEDGLIARVEPDVRADGPFVLPGLVDVHIHGSGGYDALDGCDSLEGMSRYLATRGVTSFLPTAISSSLEKLAEFATSVRKWMRDPPTNGAQPLGFNLEGPFLAPTMRGAHNPVDLLVPADVAWSRLEPLTEGLRLITIAPELPGSLDLISRFAGMGITVSLGHSDATADQAKAGYRAGATAATHLFNAMSAIDHHTPGLAAIALVNDATYVELIADGHHVDPSLWQLIWRSKPPDKLVLVSDAIRAAGTPDVHSLLGGFDVAIRGDRAFLADGRLAGSMVSLNTALRNVVRQGLDMPRAVSAASRNPLKLVQVNDRGSLKPGMRADLMLLDDDLRVVNTMVGGSWIV